MQSKDINLYPVGSLVSVPGIPEFVDIRINNISDTGVTVTGPKAGNKVVISGRTPAVFADTIVKTEQTDPEEDTDESTSDRVPRGTYTEKMKCLIMPQTPSFTISSLAELNNIPINYAAKWVKDNCVDTGLYEPKADGQKGRAPKLFKVI